MNSFLFPTFIQKIRATRMMDDQTVPFQQLWHSLHTGIDVQFWIYPKPEEELLVWMRGKKNYDFFLSQGFCYGASEAKLMTLFEQIRKTRASDIELQNRRYALRLFFEQLKGPKEHFRFWIFSFFTRPVERILKLN